MQAPPSIASAGCTVPARRASTPSTLHLLGKHQAAAGATTIVDFATMIAFVQLVHVSPVVGTIAGSIVGGVANFLLGRGWAFHATMEPVHVQAMRYVALSLSVLVLNAAGMAVIGPRVSYLAARVVVSIAVSVFWSFPLQRWFVFRASGSTGTASRVDATTTSAAA